MQRFFVVTSLLILLLAAGLFSAGVGRLQGVGLLPGGDPVWDASALLDDHGTVGGFLAGLMGYRARPSALEVVAYAVYIAVASRLFFPRLYGRGPHRQANLGAPAATSRV